MPAQAKYTQVAAVIEKRIREGDYLVEEIPGERKLADETGVSYMTARRAVTKLIEERVLTRGTNGTLEVHPKFAKQSKLAEVALLYPAFPSDYLTQLRGLVANAAEQYGFGLRPVQYVHWDERTVLETVEQAKGTLLIPYGPEIPHRLVEEFREHKTVILDGDFSGLQLPSIRLFSDDCIRRVLEHLAGLGHRRIDCINSQNHNSEIYRRIALWRSFLEEEGLEGKLWDEPAPLYTDPTHTARELMRGVIAERDALPPALIATTCPAAIGSARACWEADVRVGGDVALAAMNLEPVAEFYCPSITGLTTPDLRPVLSACFEWFGRNRKWKGEYLLQPSETALNLGESTEAIGSHETARLAFRPVV